MTLENYDAQAERAAEDSIDILQELFGKISQHNIGHVDKISANNTYEKEDSKEQAGGEKAYARVIGTGKTPMYIGSMRLSFDDLYDDLDPSDARYDDRRMSIRSAIECICIDWRNKATTRMLSFQKEGRGTYMGMIESKLSDFIINRSLNKHSSEGAAYMGHLLKRAAAEMRDYVPMYGNLPDK